MGRKNPFPLVICAYAARSPASALPVALDPLLRLRQRRRVLAPLSGPPTVVNHRLVTGTLLLVEDDPAMRGWLGNALTESGYIVHTATNGLDALRRLEYVQPDLIVLDIILPWLTGIEFLKKIAADERMTGVPIIAITGTILNEDALAEFSHVRMLLRKPFTADALVNSVQRILYGTDSATV